MPAKRLCVGSCAGHIRREALPYFFAWAAVFTWLYSCFLPNGNMLFINAASAGQYQKQAIYIWLLVCPAVAVAFRGRQYVPRTIYSVCVCFVCFITTLFFNAGGVPRIVMAVCVGHIFASCGYGFFMILNNAEKFYSMLLGIAIPKALLLAYPLLTKSLRYISYTDFILLCSLIVLLACSASFMTESSFIPDIGKRPVPKKAWSLMAMVFLVLAFNDVVAPLVLVSMKNTSGYPLHLWYFAGIAAGLALAFALRRAFRLNICMMLNISAAMLATGFVACAAVGNIPYAMRFAGACFGVAYSIGMVNIYYLAGFMAKKFQDITFYRAGIVLSASYYLLAFGAVRLAGEALTAVSLLCVLVVIAFFALTPVFMRLLYDGEWIDDTYREDVTYESRLRARLAELKLSRKETEVCELLLRGYTLRQCAAMLGIAYPTANTYCTSLYRKLNINSRTELTLLFRDYMT